MSGKPKWALCAGTWIDGTAAMTGQLSGLTALNKDAFQECEFKHCHSQRNDGLKIPLQIVVYSVLYLKFLSTLKLTPLTRACSICFLKKWPPSTDRNKMVIPREIADQSV